MQLSVMWPVQTFLTLPFTALTHELSVYKCSFSLMLFMPLSRQILVYFGLHILLESGLKGKNSRGILRISFFFQAGCGGMYL